MTAKKPKPEPGPTNYAYPITLYAADESGVTSKSCSAMSVEEHEFLVDGGWSLELVEIEDADTE